MTMHLLGPHMTTTKYNRKQKKPNAKLTKAQAEHEKWLKSMGVGKTKARNTNTIPDYKANKSEVPLSNKIAGHGPAKESMTYSGERQLLGIATMHKSNMVPIFADKKEDAKDIASMRR